jgi:xanthine/CO dehydrogenase XdhC/CoxF family maturation factor
MLAILDRLMTAALHGHCAMTDDPLKTAQQWLAKGHKIALATVVKTWGSAPRPVGSQLVVRDDGSFIGSVSGGCIEGTIIDEARSVMHGGRPRRLEFGVSDEQAWSVGLACGGRIEIFLEAVD